MESKTKPKQTETNQPTNQPKRNTRGRQKDNDNNTKQQRKRRARITMERKKERKKEEGERRQQRSNFKWWWMCTGAVEIRLLERKSTEMRRGEDEQSKYVCLSSLFERFEDG